MLTLLIGTDWIANSEAILEMIAQDVAQEMSGRILMVPELISHDTERRLCATAGDTASRFAEVLSFTRLARRVADSVGCAAPECMDNGGRIVAMAAATRQLHSRLKAYAAVETKPEFIEGLVDAVDEFKRCCIRSADLKAASLQTEGSLAQKLEELALILESYDSLCTHGKCDPRDQMTWLLEELRIGSFAAEHTFYIDGFPDFTRQHLAILEHIIKESENVVISMTCDRPDSTMLAFEKAGETAGELLRIAKRHDIKAKICPVQPRQDALADLRLYLFQGRIPKQLSHDELLVMSSDSQYHECLAVAEQIIAHLHNGARYRDISLVYADPSYAIPLEMVLERSHIPAYFSGTEPILGKSVIAAVLSAMETALGGFHREDVIRYLKSPLSPLTIDVCDKLENYVLLWGITGNAWLHPWKNHPAGLGNIWDERSYSSLEQLESARSKALEPLCRLRDAFRDATDLGQQINALYSFFCTINLDKRLYNLANELDEQGDNRGAQVLNQLWDILVCALEQLHDVLGGTVWDTESFTRLFRLLLNQYDVGTIPAVLDAVSVGPVSAMRCQRAKHLIVIGASEGNLPGYSGSAGILSDQERLALRNMGVPLTGGAMDGLKAEFAEIYGTFCGALESVTVSCPGGQPSLVYRRLQNMSESVLNVSQLLGPALSDPLEAGAYLARFDAHDAATKIGIREQYAAVKRCATHQLGSVADVNIHALYGNQLKLSASQVDKLADCRFHYFLRYGIRAKELKPADVDPAEFGTYVHAVLENTAREVCELGGFHEITEEQTLQIARKYSRQYAANRFKQLDAQRVNYLFNRNTQEMELIVRELWEELNNCKFAPIGFEVSFGTDAQMPAVDCSGTKLQAQLGGFVDRVDTWFDGNKHYFRIVDYKTGKKDFDYCDVFNGLGLQMLLYMFALEQHGEALLGNHPIPVGVQYFPARVPYIATDRQLTEEETKALREKNWKRKGLLLADDTILNAMGAENAPFRMPFTRKKDGSISGDIAKSQQFALLKDYIFGILKKMVDDIASGNVEPNPYTRGSSHNACTFCPYGAVCHKTSVENRRNYKAMSADSFWQYVQQEVSERG